MSEDHLQILVQNWTPSSSNFSKTLTNILKNTELDFVTINPFWKSSRRVLNGPNPRLKNLAKLKMKKKKMI